MKKTLIIVAIFLLGNFCLGYDLTNLGDFSSRSVLINELGLGEKKDKLSAEQKEILKEKKLSPTTNCLVQQIQKGNLENVKLLLDSKVDPNKSFYTDYPVLIATKANKPEIVYLLIDYGAKLDRGFYSELFEAIKNKNKQMAAYLIDKGARLDYQDSLTGRSSLYFALKYKMYDIAQTMINKGAPADKYSVMYIKKHKLDYMIPD